MNHPALPNPAEADRRLRVISDMREFVRDGKRAMLAGWIAGTFPTRPRMDIRADVDYWRDLAARRAAGEVPRPGDGWFYPPGHPDHDAAGWAAAGLPAVEKP